MKFKKIYIEITNICNLKCSFCSKSNRVLKELTTDEFEEIIKSGNASDTSFNIFKNYYDNFYKRYLTFENGKLIFKRIGE